MPPRFLSGCRSIAVLLLIVLGSSAAFVWPLPALAETTHNCRAFGKDPLCAGSCPAGWKEMFRIDCVTGSKAYCCELAPPTESRAKCRVAAAGYDPNREVNGKCQRCVDWERRRDCIPKGAFTGACVKFVWQDCGTPRKPTPHTELPGTKVGPLLGPSITVTWVGRVVLVRGIRFSPNAPVTIDVSGRPTTPNPRSITVDALGALITADRAGSFARRVDACNSGIQGDLTFTARDKEKPPTRPATLRCRTGVNPSDVRVKP